MSLLDRQREELLERIRDAMAHGRATTSSLARRTGLHERTIQRLLSGATRSDDTLERIARALRVELPDAAEDSPKRQAAATSGAVSGWKAAAFELGVSVDTLRRRRRGRDERYPWWASRDALFAWFESLCSPSNSQPTARRS